MKRAIFREQQIDRVTLKVAALKQDVFRAQIGEAPRGGAHRFEIVCAGFVQVGSDQKCLGNHWGDAWGELGAVLGRAHGVDNQGKLEIGGEAGDHFNDLGAAQSAGFDRGRRDILNGCKNLALDQLGIQNFNTLDTQRILHRDQRDDGFAENAELMKCLKIRLNPRPSARIGAGDG